jgi:1-acyl-sn-glycerol-3-phosphate acyltransferase
VICDGDGINAALMKENTSPGVNLTWMLDAWWFLPVEAYRTGDEAGAALAADTIARAPSDVPQGDKLLIVPEGTGTRPLVDAGFEKLADLHLYVINRSGFRRYQEYVADRYGELGVKMIKRSAARIARSA